MRIAVEKRQKAGNPAVIGFLPVRPVTLRLHLSMDLPLQFQDEKNSQKTARYEPATTKQLGLSIVALPGMSNGKNSQLAGDGEGLWNYE
jgi:hypothetical protein